MSSDPTTKTCLDLVAGSLRKIGQYAPGESLNPNDAQDACDTFNGMLDLWSNQNLSVYNQIETVQSLTAGQSSYTVGTGGYFNIERPIRPVRAYSRLTSGSGSVDFQCEFVTLEKYSRIGIKTQPGPWPKMAYYNTGYPQSTLIVWPVPQSNVEFHMWSDQVFTSLELTDPIALPRGYFLGLQMNLAELLCMEYGMSVPPDVKRFAKEFRDIIKATNASPTSEASVDPAIVASSGSDAGWVLTGGFQ